MESKPITQETKNQLKVIGTLGCYKFDTIIHWDKKDVDKMAENLHEAIMNSSEFNDYAKNYYWYKRPEINIKDTPYSGRFDYLQGREVIGIQQIYTDDIKMKICGEEKDLAYIEKVHSVHEDMSDEDFFKANAVYRNDINRIREVEAKFNQSQEIVDINGLHVTQLDDFDNYKYVIENISEKYVYEIYSEERLQRRLQSEEEYLQKKIFKFESDIAQYEFQIVGLTLHEDTQPLIRKLSEYSYNQGSELYSDMIEISQEYKMSLKNCWNIWKFISLEDMRVRYEEICAIP